ncbi:MAG TPA: ankyrin repeat domain-containing protein [Gemmatimonadaceae bacterium]
MPDAIHRRFRSLAAALSAALLFGAWAPATVDSPVADAAMRGDTARVRVLLRQGADVNASQGDGMTALHWAATRGDAGQVAMLVYAGARLEASTRNGNYTPLHLAARGGRAVAVKALLKAGADAKAVTSAGGATPLHLAAGIGSTESISALLDAGAGVDAREGAWGQTPLMWAANYDRVEAVKLLLSRGADIKAISKVESVPERERTDAASRSLRNRRVAALAQAEQPLGAGGRGAPPAGGRGGAPATLAGRAGTPGNAATPATTAPDSTARGRQSTATTPVPDSASSQDQGGQRGYPPPAAAPDSQQAAAAGRAGRAGGGGGGRGGRGAGGGERGLSYGELVGSKGGLTPLLFAAREGNMETVKILLAAGAPIGQASEGDHTSPMLMAAINGHFDIAKLLLERGASPNQMSDAGATPLYATINVQYAAKSLYPQPTAQKQQKTTYLELMEALLKLGANPNARLSKHLWYMSYNFDLLGVNTTGASPFWRAAYGTDVPAMRLLLRYGADPSVATRKPAGRQRGDDAPVEDDGEVKDPSGLPPIPNGGPGVYPIHAASGVGYGEGYAANSHMHAPDGWIPSVKFLIEELGVDVNSRDHNGFTPLHHAAARGDIELIMYLMSKGADIAVVSRRGQTVADMANGPVQRIPPFVETVALLEKLGSKNSHKCRSC